LQSNSKIKREQSSFSVEREPKRPVNVPDDVLEILRQDEGNQKRLVNGPIPASWFAASEIHLNDDDLADLVVMANNPRLLGANIGPYWLFRNTPHGYELVLRESALILDVLTVRTKGYRDVRLVALSAKEKFTVLYRFNGNEYEIARSSQAPIRD
jgi:hypothetical protein